MRLYCKCGRKIVVFKSKGMKGVKAPKREDGHDLCQRCYKSERDSMKVKVDMGTFPY